jgi:radical SAM superfamily enzyme YgiQ (UPF0313 family)
MPHVAFVPFSGFRIREAELLKLGMTLPGLTARARAIGELPALGLLTLAGMLPQDWTCSYHPVAQANHDCIERIVAEQPTLVAVSALTASIKEAYLFCDRLRACGVCVVIGGLHATTCPDEAQQHCDAVVVGEGEFVWPDLLRDAEQQRLKPRYTSAEYAATHAARLDWPIPRYDLLGASPSRFTLQTARGCPLTCDFCGASRLLGPFREKPLAAIRRELEAILTINPRPLIELADDNTFVGQRNLSELFDLFEQSHIRYFTEADWRIALRPELLDRLAASGCVQVLVGIESLVFRYPGMGGKRAELDRIMDAVAAIQQAGVAANGCFIIGADGETHESLDRLVEFILASSLAEVQITLQTPFPGTGLHRRLEKQGRLLPDRGWSHYTLFDVTYQPDKLSVDELESGFRQVLRQVYSAEATRRRKHLRRACWLNNPRLHA